MASPNTIDIPVWVLFNVHSDPDCNPVLEFLDVFDTCIGAQLYVTTHLEKENQNNNYVLLSGYRDNSEKDIVISDHCGNYESGWRNEYFYNQYHIYLIERVMIKH